MRVYRALLRALLERAGWGSRGSGVSSPVTSQLGEIWAWLACGKLGKRSRFSVIARVLLVCCFLKGGMCFFLSWCILSVCKSCLTQLLTSLFAMLGNRTQGVAPARKVLTGPLPSLWAGNLSSSGAGSSWNLWLLIPSFWKESWDTAWCWGQERVGLALVSLCNGTLYSGCTEV